MKPSCGCLNPRLAKRVYEPGESGEFFVRVQTAGEKSGQKEYYVDVLYEDSKPRQVQLGFDFVLPERKVVVHPRALIFYQLGTDATSREITISDYRDARLTVLEATCKSPYVSITIGPAQTISSEYRTTKVKVTVSGIIPPGKHQTILNLTTDRPNLSPCCAFHCGYKVRIAQFNKPAGRRVASRLSRGWSGNSGRLSRQ